MIKSGSRTDIRKTNNEITLNLVYSIKMGQANQRSNPMNHSWLLEHFKLLQRSGKVIFFELIPYQRESKKKKSRFKTENIKPNQIYPKPLGFKISIWPKQNQKLNRDFTCGASSTCEWACRR